MLSKQKFIMLLEDLRFFIGGFFLIVGLLLTITGIIRPVETAGVNLNLVVGVVFVIFGSCALVLAYRGLNHRR